MLIFLAPNFECFTKYDTFCSRSFDYACLRRLRHIAYEEIEIMEKFYSSKALLKMAGRGEMYTPHRGDSRGGPGGPWPPQFFAWPPGWPPPVSTSIGRL